MNNFSLGPSAFNPDTFNPRVYYLSYEHYDSDNLLPNHIHAFPTIMFVDKLAGRCTYCIETQTYEVQRGDLILINPGVFHCKKLSIGSEIHEVHMAFDGLTLIGIPSNYIAHPDTHIVTRLEDSEQADFQRCMEAFFDEQEFVKPFSELYAKALLMQLLVLVFRQLHRSTPSSGDGARFKFTRSSREGIVAELRDYLVEHHAENISLSIVASRMYISPEYLSRIFKTEVGKSPLASLIEIRLNKAKDMLENESLSIADVSKSVGYCDVYHFSKLFKKYFSIAPLNYRKMLKKSADSGSSPWID